MGKFPMAATFDLSKEDESEPYVSLTEVEGGGHVRLEPDFDELPSLQQADLIHDWINSLQALYDGITGEGFLSDMGGSGINEPPASEAVN